MGVRYLADGTTPSYECNEVHVRRAGPTCQCIRGDGVDAAVARVLLEAMQPAQLAISLATLEQVEAQARQIERQWQLRLERARYEADLARRRFLAVDPDNRLVARTLERDWNDKLAAIASLERESVALPRLTTRLVSPEERQRIVALAQDVPAVWHAATTTQTERKQLLRFLIKDVTLTKRAATVALAIRWQTDACTTLEIPRPQRSWEIRRTNPAAVARVRELAPDQTDREIAARLTAEGYTAGLGGPFTRAKVQWLRWKYQLPRTRSDRPAARPNDPRGDGRYSARAAADLLNVDVGTIADWCLAGRLECQQAAPHCPRWITLTAERIAVLRKPVRQRKPRRPPT